MLLPHHGEGGAAVHALLDRVHLEEPRLLLTDLGFQRPEHLPADPERGLLLVELLDGLEEGLQPLVLLSSGAGVDKSREC